jgi:hypothetical protein
MTDTQQRYFVLFELGRYAPARWPSAYTRPG